MVVSKTNLSFGSNSISLDMDNVKSGIYLLRIISGEEVKVLKIMVN
jgi:hypothetical protein